MTTDCPHCQGHSTFLFTATDTNRRVSSESFQYYRCAVCGLIFLFPIPDNLAQFYDHGYYSAPGSTRQVTRQEKHELAKLDLLLKYVERRGKLLEIGPGRGSFAQLAKEAGFAVEAIEMDKETCLYIEKSLGIRAYLTDQPDQVLSTLGEYDVIVMWQVIEHLRSPWRTLRSAAMHLSEGGILVIATPNPYSYQLRIFQKRWLHIDAPRHVQLIPSRLLSQKAAELQLMPITQVPFGTGNAAHNRAGWQGSLINILPIWLRVFRPMRLFLQAVGALIGNIMKPIEHDGLRGSTYTMIFRK
ncbi:MAG: methyltransferase domain-containing protein [Deltaproteobacteria bacterium]|nr:methyltransferase domain-containing protein [Deltaproteobacteria bacterium]